MKSTRGMKKRLLRTTMALLVSLALVAMAAACSRGGSNSAAPTEAPAEATAAPATEATEAQAEPTEAPTEEPTDAPATEPEATEAPAVTEAAEASVASMDGDVESLLANATYPSEFTQDGTARLVDGAYSEQAAPGSAISTTVTLLPQYTALGELDGQPAAAVILATDPGGSGTFVDLGVVTIGDGQPVTVTTTQLGDRVEINAVAIEDNQIIVDMLTQGPDDPMCCPSQEVVQTYELQDGELVLVDTQEIETPPDSATPAPETSTQEDVATIVANATYPSEFTQGGTATLVDGTYAEQAAPDSAISTTVTLLPQYTALGQLDGQPAAAVILATNPGGSGTFIDLGVVTIGDGEPVTVATTELGDRVEINSVSIENNQVVVDMLTQGPDDPMCCPSQEVVQTYELQDGALVLVDTQEAGTSSTAGDPDPVAAETEASEVAFPDVADDVAIGLVTAPAGVNVRTGPGTDYPILGIAPEGTVGQIVGVSADGQWWVVAVVESPDGQGWVDTAYVDATGTEGVPVIAAPLLSTEEADLNDMLGNATYPSEFTQDGIATLVDGKFAEQAAPGSAISTTVTLLPQYTAVGDLNGQPAAAAIIATNPGGSGTFISLAVVTYGDGQPVTVATTHLGDRVQVNSITIADNEVVVDMLTQGPDDPMCCPSQQVQQTYELQDGELVLVNTEELGTSSTAADPDPVTDTSVAAVEFPEVADGVPTGVIVADEGVNVRTGPGTGYPVIGIAPPGTIGEIVGISADGQWWVAAVAAGPYGEGWVSTAYVEAVSADDVPVIPTPPLP